MIYVFFDTEFTGLTVDPKLISIGLVDEHGNRAFYAELTETWLDHEVGDFARLAVLPYLEGSHHRMGMDELSARLAAWIEAFPEPVKLVTDAPAWDWPWIQEIFPDVENWPANLDGKPALMHEIADFPAFNRALEAAFASGLRRHHALDDAKANRLAWLASKSPA